MVGLGGAAGSMLRYGMTLLGSALNLSGNVATFGVNILATVTICVAMAWFGYKLGQSR